MKKICLSLLAMLCVSAIAFAQEYYPEKGNIVAGITGGLSTATINISDDANNSLSPSTRTGFNAGIFGDFYFSDRWSLKVVADYAQKGWKNSSDFEDGDYHLNYIDVPVMANWHFGRKRNWYLNFGPYVGFLTSAEATKLDADIKQAFKSTDFGLNLGIGVKFPLSDNVRLSLELGGAASFASIIKGEFNNTDLSFRNSSGIFNIGFEFPLR